MDTTQRLKPAGTTPAPTLYTCGLLFTEDRENVALILKKTGPEALVDRWNGIGGKVEPQDYKDTKANGDVVDVFQVAQSREFGEETGLNVPAFQWQTFATMRRPDYTVHFMRATCFGTPHLVTRTQEVSQWWTVYGIRSGETRIDLAPNIRWLLEAALYDLEQVILL